MNNEVMKADNHDPDYRKAMLFHSDRADQYAAERDAAVAEAATLRDEVERLRGALERIAADVPSRRHNGNRNDLIAVQSWNIARAALEGKT